MELLKQQYKEVCIREMVDAGDLKQLGDGLYEDMGGHLIHESHEIMDDYIENFLTELRPKERNELLKKARAL